MEIGPGQVYRRSNTQGSEWFVSVLGEAHRVAVEPIPISIMTTSGNVLSGRLEGTEGSTVKLREQGEPDVAEIDGDDIEAFTVLAEPPPDPSPELRG